ncbi:MAG TPA: hypothetical protein VKG91_14790 [Roseiarcus sp.]|nr:hypothetical protein [Roseiarcus sp.]
MTIIAAGTGATGVPVAFALTASGTAAETARAGSFGGAVAGASGPGCWPEAASGTGADGAAAGDGTGGEAAGEGTGGEAAGEGTGGAE